MSDFVQGSDKSRRTVLAAGVAAAAGGLVVAGSGKAEAANGDPIIAGQVNTSSAMTRLTNSADAIGLRIDCTNTGPQARALVTYTTSTYGVLATASDGNAGKFVTESASKYGLWAENSSTSSDAGLAVYAVSKATGEGAAGATAVRAFQGAGGSEILQTVRAARWPAAGEFAGPNGVIGASAQDGGVGVIGHSETSVGVWATTAAPGGVALHSAGNATVDGDLAVQGTVSKFGGSFRIDHPLDPANKYLSHSFVESPDMMNVYNGTIEADQDGAATVELPDWFETLNRDFRYQLTPIGAPAPDLHISAEVSKNRFSIAAAAPGQKISWQVTGIRHDPWAEKHRIPVEHPKPKAEQGTYLYPEGHGKPPADRLNPAPSR